MVVLDNNHAVHNAKNIGTLVFLNAPGKFHKLHKSLQNSSILQCLDLAKCYNIWHMYFSSTWFEVILSDVI